MFSRRSLLGWLAAAPAVAAVLKMAPAEAKPVFVQPVNDVVMVRPIIGELRYAYASACSNDHTHTYSGPESASHTHTFSDGVLATPARFNYEIFDGEKFVPLDSYEGSLVAEKLGVGPYTLAQSV